MEVGFVRPGLDSLIELEDALVVWGAPADEVRVRALSQGVERRPTLTPKHPPRRADTLRSTR